MGVDRRQRRKEKSAYERRPRSLISFSTLFSIGDFSMLTCNKNKLNICSMLKGQSHEIVCEIMT
jgi:hypothetical protein